ncbi:MAG: septum formation inhibitor Maf [Deltaproteobacteria bacterium]|nr:septum formation inhibitor Maf [Deltaproteobacteria bacterium]
MTEDKKIILASASPRRKELLKDISSSFEVRPADVDEGVREDESPVGHTRRLAREKTGKVGEGLSGGIIIGADTVVVIDGEILGKPKDTDDARRMLGRLSGKAHTVVTSFCILNARTKETIAKTVESKVTMRRIHDAELEEYLETGEPLDKAGAYAVQGIGGKFIETVKGSYTNVVGLPVDEVKEALKKMGQ